MSELVVTTVTTETVNSSTGVVGFVGNAMTIPVGNSSVRPGTPTDGNIRYNNEDEVFEGYKEGGWDTISMGVTIGKRGLFKVNDPELDEDLTIRAKLITANVVNTTSDYIEQTPNAYVNGEVVQVGATTTVPAGLSANTDYYIINANTTAFQVATARGGANVDITSAGAGTITFWKPIRSSVVGPLLVANSYTLTVANGSTLITLGE